MKKKYNFIDFPIIVLLIFLTNSCFMPEQPKSGEIEVLIMSSDAIYTKENMLPDVEAIRISISKVEIHKEGAEWNTIVDNGEEGIPYDLLEIAEDATIVGLNELDTGIYTQIRLILGKNNTIIINNGSDSEEHDLTIPSGGNTGIKLNTEFEITETGNVRIVLDFIIEESIVISGNGKCKFKPTIRIGTIYYN